MISMSFEAASFNKSLIFNAIISGCIAVAVVTEASAADFDVSKTVRIAMANEPPATELKADGTMTGAGPDIDRAVLKLSGFSEFEGQVMPYGSMIPALQAGRVSMVSSGSLNITPERCKQVIYSEPVICGAQGFMVRAEDEGLDSFKVAATRASRIAVPAGSSLEKDALAAGVKPENLIIYPDGTSAIKMLQSKRVDVILLYASGLIELKKRSDDPSLRIIAPLIDGRMECAAAAFRKSDTALRDAYNAGLAKLKANGEYMTVLTSYGYEEQAKITLKAKSAAEMCDEK